MLRERGSCVGDGDERDGYESVWWRREYEER